MARCRSEQRGTTVKQTTPSDTIALTTTSPEHCLHYFRLIRPGETYCLGRDDTVPSPNFFSKLLIGEVAVDSGGGPIRMRKEGAATIIAPSKARRLIDTLVEAATRVVDKES